MTRTAPTLFIITYQHMKLSTVFLDVREHRSTEFLLLAAVPQVVVLIIDDY